MSILVLNCGSSSIKFALFEQESLRELAAGAVERVGEESALLRCQVSRKDEWREAVPEVTDHATGVEQIFQFLSGTTGIDGSDALTAIGHRVVHGGESFHEPAPIDRDVLSRIAEAADLAPIHNPANLLGIECALRRYPELPQVAVFDTAFHQTMPAYAYRYALPERFYTEHHIRRFGFHGTSHDQLARRASQILGRPPAECRLITLHLGNGASVAAIRGGECVDTSMGMTPLEGLIMGTRCGDLDPSVPLMLQRRNNMAPIEVERLLNDESGLQGLAGVNDMREIHRLRDDGHPGAQLAFEVFCYRVKKYIGAYLAVLGGADGIVFSGGIGENDSAVRERCLAGLAALGLAVDPALNATAGDGDAIQSADSRIAILVIRSDETREIAEKTRETLRKRAAKNPPHKK